MSLEEIKAALAKVRAEMEFHDDSEVHWDELHSAISWVGGMNGSPQYPDKCMKCSNSIYDDRWHLFVSVTTFNERFASVAPVYEKLLHAKRREVWGMTREAVHEYMLGFAAGKREK